MEKNRGSGVFASMRPKRAMPQWGSPKVVGAAEILATTIAHRAANAAWTAVRKDLVAIVFAVVCVAVIVVFCWTIAQKQSFEDQMRKIARDYRKEVEVRAKQLVAPDIEARDLKELAELYVKGIPDQYDRGRLVNGIQPDHEAAIRLLNEAIKMEYDVPGHEPINTIIDLANLLYTSETNKDVELSRSLYLYVHQYGDTVQRALASDRLDQIAQYIHGERINERRARELGTAQRDRDELAVANRPVQIQVMLPPRPQLGDRVAQQARDNAPGHRLGGGHARADLYVDRRLQRAPEVRNDPQNVHDSTLLRSLSDTLRKMGPGEQTRRDDIERAIVSSNVSHDRKANALRALGTIFRTQAHVSGINATEIDALDAVWAQVRGNKDREEALVTELSEMVEHGAVVCATGRAARVLDTMNIIAPGLSDARPKWAVAREILDKSSVLFNRHVDRLSPAEKAVFNMDTGSPSEIKEYRRIADKVAQGMRNDLQTEYVRPGIISDTDLNAEVGKWMPDLFIEPSPINSATAAATPMPTPTPTSTPTPTPTPAAMPIVAVATPVNAPDTLQVATPIPLPAPANIATPAAGPLPVATPTPSTPSSSS